MLAFMSKTISSINEELKIGKTILVTAVQQPDAIENPDAQMNDRTVDAVTTATVQNTMHRIPYNLPAVSKDPE
jgi:uncharacterized protein (DUF39 family)